MPKLSAPGNAAWELEAIVSSDTSVAIAITATKRGRTMNLADAADNMLRSPRRLGCLDPIETPCFAAPPRGGCAFFGNAPITHSLFHAFRQQRRTHYPNVLSLDNRPRRILQLRCRRT